jgi:hypothetical protein
MTMRASSHQGRKMIKRGSALPSPASANNTFFRAHPAAVQKNAAALLFKGGDLHNIHRTRLGG